MPVPTNDEGAQRGYELGLARACGADRERVATARFRQELLIENGVGNGSRLTGFEQGMLNGRAVRAPAPAECARALAALEAGLRPAIVATQDAAPGSPLAYVALAPRSAVRLRLLYAQTDGSTAEWLIEAHGVRGTWRSVPDAAGRPVPVFDPRLLEAQIAATGQSVSLAVAAIARIGPANGPLTADVANFLRRLLFRGA